MSPNQEKLEVTKETQEKRQPSQVHGDVGSTLCRSSRCSLRVQETYLFGFTAALKIFSLTKGLPTASTNTENMATQRSDRPQTQKKKKRSAWDLQTHRLSRYWHTGGRRNVLPALKSTRVWPATFMFLNLWSTLTREAPGELLRPLWKVTKKCKCPLRGSLDNF